MSRIKCAGCTETPRFTAVSFDKQGTPIRGEKCNLCGMIRVIQTRKAPKRDARRAAFETALLRVLAS
jgi:formate dehydrogenase maturation protein FdhE